MPDKQTPRYNMVAENEHSTVVSKYTPQKQTSQHYQNEAELEQSFINQLKQQAYEYLPITSEQDLVKNLRVQLEKLNNISFTDDEWNRFFTKEIANTNDGIQEKTQAIQKDYIKNLTRNDGSTKNIYLMSKESIHDNTLQVINQYETERGKRKNRYDVTILVNGLPLIHIELKRRGIPIQEAFNHINRYQRESFWSGNGLFEYIQLFVISNGTHTKYYSNTTRDNHIRETIGSTNKSKRTNNSFQFTSWWADAQNKPIFDLVDFTKTFFAKHTLLNVLTRYCVFDIDQQLLAMRPYQIVATERILNRIEISTNYKKLGTINAGGYIWHTTGSGKTLTSFKTAQLATEISYIKKVLFVVDRKDLDYQTMREYDRYEKGAANSNTSTAKLKEQLQDQSNRIIITTIQKLDRFIKQNKGHTIFDDHTVIIFDECHRSQFGDMHINIKKSFKKYNLFGFTGTPIFAKNALSSSRANLKTTEQAFGDKLHTYTIVDAVNDKNVLPFKIDYTKTIREAENIQETKVRDIDRESALLSDERISNIVHYIRENFNKKTQRNTFYEMKKRRMKGFNSILAVSSINAAKKYYAEFQKQLKDVPSDSRLKIALIYSFGVNDEEIDGMMDENSEDTQNLTESDRDFLDSAIQDYNTIFNVSFDTSSDKFQNYYKDVSMRVKNREIDILIVVNMFLTGFDATTLNTLWVDKNLRLHGLLQAYSRTNRILNSVKVFGNIVCFRNLEHATNESIALFGDKEAGGIVLLRPYDDYYYGYMDGEKEVPGYKDLIQRLQETFPLQESIQGEQLKKDFIKLFGKILRAQNILNTFDEFTGNEILTERDMQDYRSMYIDLYNEFKQEIGGEKENINEDLIFEMELVKQVEINIDYILDLIQRYHDDHTRSREILLDIERAIQSSFELRNKRELIRQFIESLGTQSIVNKDWRAFVEKKKVEELEAIITKEKLNRTATYTFIENAFQNGEVAITGTGISGILPPISRFSPTYERTKKRKSVIEKLTLFFEKFFDISNKTFSR